MATRPSPSNYRTLWDPNKILNWILRIIPALWIVIFHKIFYGWITELINPGMTEISSQDFQDFVAVSILFAIVIAVLIIIKMIIKRE